MLNRIPRLATKLSALALLLAPAACSEGPSRIVTPDVEVRTDLSGIPSTAVTPLTITSLSPSIPYGFPGGTTNVGPLQATGAGAIGTFEIVCINFRNFIALNDNIAVRSLTFTEAIQPTNLPALKRTLGEFDDVTMLRKLRQAAYLSAQFNLHPTSDWDEIHAAIWKLFDLTPFPASAFQPSNTTQEAALVSASASWADNVANSTSMWRVVVDSRAWDPNFSPNSSLAQTFITQNNPASLGNRVWHDLDADGVQDAGELGIAGAKVTATGPNGALVDIHTDENGNYLFSDLPAGQYTVCVALPAGFTDVSPSAQGGNGALDSDGSGAGNCATVTLAAGQSNLDVDFGFFKRVVTGSIGNYTWIDANGNGRQDAGEPFLNGVSVTLGGPTTGTKTTSGAGNYLFDKLAAGTYAVTATAPAGFTFTTANSPLANSGTDSNGSPTTVTLAAGENNLTIDFGFVPLPGSGQGCTPGFWKQSQKFGNWKWYTQADMVDAVFGVTFRSTARNNPTGPLNLLQALELNGNGGAEQLFRHGTAALLNAVYQSGVSYPYTASQVITMVRTAWLNRDATLIASTHRQLSEANERGCPLN